MKFNNRSTHGYTQAFDEFKAPDNTLLTYNFETKRLYFHSLDYPLQTLRLSGYQGKINYAQFLHDASEINFSEPRQRSRQGDSHLSYDIELSLPVTKPNIDIPVIEVFLN